MNTSIFRAKESAIKRIFGRGQAVIGVVHSLPLPGSPHYDGEPVETIYRYACEEAERYGAGGVDGLIVENPEMTEALKNARARDANAQLKIARAYELGKEIPRNLTRALSWYLVAARHGSKEAEAAGSALRRRLTSFQITDAEMASYELLK